jgi:group I intron endonuclease
MIRVIIVSNMPEIYKITCIPAKKSYIGQTKYTAEYRWNKHVATSAMKEPKARRTAIHNAIIKYGKENFVIETVEFVDICELDEAEILYINYFETLCPKGYNIQEGGTHRAKWSVESREKKSKAKRVVNTTYELPLGIREINEEGRHGFRLQMTRPKCDESFTISTMEMEDKRLLAIEIRRKIIAGEELPDIRYDVEPVDGIYLPRGINLKGTHGFSTYVKGQPREACTKKGNTQKENLLLTIEKLAILKQKAADDAKLIEENKNKK